jgi:polyisoprenoid-binding protein YceI
MMIQKLLAVAFTLMIAITATAQQTNWNLDNSHSSVKFAVTHMVVSETEGMFKKFQAVVSSITAASFEGATINFTIDAASINTDDEKRDAHLKGDDFLETDKFPTISFVSTSMKSVGGKNYKLSGNLTMHGVTKPVVLDVIFNGIVKSPWGTTIAGFRITGEVDRTQFGLTWGKALETGGLVVDNKVKITCNIELNQAK